MNDELGINSQQYQELLKRGWRPAEIALAMPSEIADALAEPIPQEPYEDQRYEVRIDGPIE